MSSPPRCVSPLVDSTWKTPSSTRRIEMSNVPPPKSYTAMRPAWRLSRPYASEAAVGSLMMRRTSRPAMRPASRVAVRCASLKYAGTVMTARSTSGSISPCFGEVRLGAALQLSQDERRNLRRRELARSEPDLDDPSRVAGEAEREQPRFVADIVNAFPHEALHRVDGPARDRSAADARPRGRRRRCGLPKPRRPTGRGRRRCDRGSRPGTPSFT